MGSCLIQQLFRQKIGLELDSRITDEFIFPLLRSVPRNIRESCRNLMVDIQLMKPNAIMIKGSIFEVHDYDLSSWRQYDLGISGVDYPSWKIKPLSVGTEEDNPRVLHQDDGVIHCRGQRWAEPPTQYGHDDDYEFAPTRALNHSKKPYMDGSPIHLNRQTRLPYGEWSEDHAENIRPLTNLEDRLNPITWNAVDIINRLRVLDIPDVQRKRDQSGGYDGGYIALKEANVIKFAREATMINEIWEKLFHGTELRGRRVWKEEMRKANNEYVNNFLEEAVSNDEVIYWNEIKQGLGEWSLVLSKSYPYDY